MYFLQFSVFFYCMMGSYAVRNFWHWMLSPLELFHIHSCFKTFIMTLFQKSSSQHNDGLYQRLLQIRIPEYMVLSSRLFLTSSIEKNVFLSEIIKLQKGVALIFFGKI